MDRMVGNYVKQKGEALDKIIELERKLVITQRRVSKIDVFGH